MWGRLEAAAARQEQGGSVERLHPSAPDSGGTARSPTRNGDGGPTPVRAEPSPTERQAELARRKALAVSPGGSAGTARQRDAGKLSARARLECLFDPDTFIEVDELSVGRTASPAQPRYGDGVVTGWGLVHGREVCASSQDFAVAGGALGQQHGARIAKVMELAERMACPLVSINDSAGANVAEGVDSLAAYGEIARRHVRMSGFVPQISMVLGPCAGGAAYTAALTDFVVMVDGISQMFVTGPDVAARAIGGPAQTKESLGGARTCMEVSGTNHYLANDEDDAFEWVRALLAVLPQNCNAAVPQYSCRPTKHPDDLDIALDAVIPTDPQRAWDMLAVIQAVLDRGDEFLEVQHGFGRSVTTGFGLVDGSSVGILASNPLHAGGALDSDASDKAARFVRFCDAFGVPIVTLVDVPGYVPGVTQERAGIVRRGAKLVHAFAEATVPRVTVISRKAYGGGYVSMGSKHLGADLVFAWPTAEISIMSSDTAVGIMQRSRSRREVLPHADAVLAHRAEFATPYKAAAAGHIDGVIQPHETRFVVSRALRALNGTQDMGLPRKHNTMPL